MFGHALRLHIQTPAQKAMEYYFTEEKSYKKFKGRQRMTLPAVLNNDIKELNSKHPGEIELVKFETIEDLQIARNIAQDRSQWKKLINKVNM